MQYVMHRARITGPVNYLTTGGKACKIPPDEVGAVH